MKKKLFYIIPAILVLAAILVACILFFGKPFTPETGGIPEYFPFRADTMYTYEGYPSELFNQLAYAGYIDGNSMQRIVHQASTLTTEVFKYENGELRITFANPAVYEFIDVMDEPANLDYLLLKEPFKVGAKWSMTGEDTTEIVAIDTEVQTPYGTFSAMEVVTSYPSGDKEISYWVKDIGLVKRVVQWGETESGYSLYNIEDNAKSVVNLTLFRLDSATLASVTERVAFEFATNDDIFKLLEDMLKAEVDGYTPLLTPNTKINSISFNHAEELLIFDISGEFISELNIDHKEESLMLQCLANTIGNFYKIPKFAITIDGEKYRSNNLTFLEIDKGGYLLVDGQQPGEGLSFDIENQLLN